jgi:hypothetical protein
MNENPLTKFFFGLRSYNPIDVAVLVALIPYQAAAVDSHPYGLMPLSIKTRIWTLDLPEAELSKSIDRLVEIGEIYYVNNEDACGYSLERFAELVESITEYGGRRYMRNKAREHRDRKLAAKTQTA